MHRWNERQPGGQGLTAHFNVYFKGLSETDKEVCSFTQACVDADPLPTPSHLKRRTEDAVCLDTIRTAFPGQTPQQ